MNTFYRFYLNGITYNATGANGIDLTGARFEEIYKLRTVRTGIIK